MRTAILLPVLSILLLHIGPAAQALAAPLQSQGSLKGQVVDAETGAAIPGVSVSIPASRMGAVSRQDGRFEIGGLPVGSYTVQCSHVAYETLRITDVIIRPDRITTIECAMSMHVVQTEGVEAGLGYFRATDVQEISTSRFTAEEIRRSPGSAGDVSRIIAGLPSLAKVNDQSNSLIVRGGSPIENAFFVDNIEIPNINHFPTQGSSGGPIGMLHVDFIRDVEFSAGGFGAAYGDRLSSVMNISLREGNRDRTEAQLDFNLAGIGLMGEGPVPGVDASWMAAFRRSYLDFLVGSIAGDENAPIPQYSDWQSKLHLRIDDQNLLSFIDIGGLDKLSFDAEAARENAENIYSDVNMLVNTAGLTWRKLWGSKGYSQTSLSHTITEYDNDFFETSSERRLIDNNSTEQEWKLRNNNFIRFSAEHKLEFGIDAKLVQADYDVYYAAYTDPLGGLTPELRTVRAVEGYKLGAFAAYSFRPFDALELTPGVRLDYFDYTNRAHISGRLAWNLALSADNALYGACGNYYQNLPAILLSQKEEFKELNDPQALHAVLGYRHLLSDDTRLTVESYYKEYRDFPLNPAQPQMFIIDEVVYRYGLFLLHEELHAGGKARSAGIELTIQKKLAQDFYGLLSGSLFTSEYRDYHNHRRDRTFDNRYLVSVEGGYKPNETWEFSLRWIYAGGVPYTPFDMAATRELNRGVYDNTRVNEARLPDYHSLNLRVDRRFHFSSSNLVLYLSVWNVYGRENVAAYEWNEVERKVETITQWGTLPVLGVEFEF